MPKLTVRRGDLVAAYSFTGTPTLAEALSEAGFPVPQPCGGRGACGKCAVTALTGEAFPSTDAEIHAGRRLACQARLWGDCAVTLPPEQAWKNIETDADDPVPGVPMPGHFGAAVDLGTTTVAARVYDLATGRMLGQAAAPNPQAVVAADVMGRVSAALTGGGERLRTLALNAVLGTVARACDAAEIPGADALTVAGNTVMLYLLTGRSPQSLAAYPFQADYLFDMEETLGGIPAYLPPCAAAFMGADLTCAALATSLCDRTETTLLMDIGTNGELMLWHNGRLYAASAPAGPAFEGVNISQGMGGVEGAIDKVWVEGAGLGSRALGGGEAAGLCGSGLIDAVAALLRLGHIDPTGAADAPFLPISGRVGLTAADVRAVQLAKAAIAAGVETLLAEAGITAPQVARLELAGGFGSRLSVPSAVAIGLIPAPLAGRARTVGNASLAGAAALLTDTRLRAKAEAIARAVTLVPLGGSAAFEERFLANMNFPDAER